MRKKISIYIFIINYFEKIINFELLETHKHILTNFGTNTFSISLSLLRN